MATNMSNMNMTLFVLRMDCGTLSPSLCIIILTMCCSQIVSKPELYRSYYNEDDRPNRCSIAFESSFTSVFMDREYIPFLGMSITSDQQLLLLRLLHSIDYPVKRLIVVAQRPAHHNNTLLKAELAHARQYIRNIVLIYCDSQPAVTEAWNAVFTAYPEEPWGIYVARDVQVKPKALDISAGHAWNNPVLVGLS
jgi:hypothetical protein